VLWTSDDDGTRSLQDGEVTANDNNSNTATSGNTDNGALLPHSSTNTSSGSESSSSYIAINKLIQTVLLSDKTAADSMIHDAFTLKWSFANNLNLVFVAVYFSFQKLLYVDDLLETIKKEFIKMFEDSLKEGIMKIAHTDYSTFYVQYKRIQKYYKTQYRSVKKPRKWSETTQGKQHSKYKIHDSHKDKKNKDKSSNKAGETDDDDNNSPSKPFAKKPFGRKTSSGPRAFDASKRAKSQRNVSKKDKKKAKQDKEHWSSLDVLNFNKKKVSKQEMDSLNFAISDEGEQGQEGNTNNNKQQQQQEEEEEVIWTPQGDVNLESSDDSSDDDDYSDLFIPNRSSTATATTNTDSSSSKNGTSTGSAIWSKFSKLIGNKPLTEQDIGGVLHELENSLSSKNVANVIAKELCDSVKKQLIGKEIGTFSTIRSVVQTAMTESLERILRPTRPINILHGIRTAQEEGRPFSMVFIGVNGVGKSTSLSKVIHYLKSRNLRVSVAACDTFRSGAVEQLKTHCRALNVRLFSQGYARDAGAVALRAIQEGKKQKDDVVLIDTAGRMQNNAPLMRSLVSLIQRNKPDLTLFVGEALVGNDGVDQLMEFNRALQLNGNTHLIDGIILTKFDTVDDKVGAAISMTYKSRKPIVFIGTGQNYHDLKRLHAATLIKKLLQ